jgi:hypothetical protein
MSQPFDFGIDWDALKQQFAGIDFSRFEDLDFGDLFGGIFDNLPQTGGGGGGTNGPPSNDGGADPTPDPGDDDETAPPPGSDEFDEEMGEFDDAWELLEFYLEDWGLESLGSVARDMILEGDSIEVVALKLRETPAYKERFAGNELRRKKGLPVLSPAEYVQVERQYKEIMRRTGLPQGFYDTMDDFVKFIEADVSPQELNDRATMAATRYINAGQEMRDQWGRLGLTPGSAIAAMLDTERAMPVLQRMLNTASIAAEAQKAFNDMNRLSLGRADELARAGVTEGQAQEAFGELAGRQDRDQWLSRLAGFELDTEDLENELLFNDQKVGDIRRRALATEESRFRGNFLAQETGFRKDTSGSY